MSAQNVKKYVLLEHFTNTRCGICATSNPAFFTAINVENNKNVHHMSIHSSIPYADCKLYGANKTEQDARATFYDLPGTPRVSVNGAALANVSNITANSIQTFAVETSPLSVLVTETTGASRTATVKLKTVGALPTGTHKLNVAIVEKKVDYAGPNGEAVHYNVFRKWLNNADVTLGALNAEITATYNYTLDASWNAAQIYVLAFVQNNTSKAVINSGTRFDVTSATDEPSVDAQVSVSPNPTKEKVFLSFDKITPQYLTVSNTVGQVVERVNTLNSAGYELNMSSYPSGIYFIKLKSVEGVALKKVVKE
jgi:Outer membrane protein Omp28/Secretion system C-terminal sorting domain